MEYVNGSEGLISDFLVTLVNIHHLKADISIATPNLSTYNFDHLYLALYHP